MPILWQATWTVSSHVDASFFYELNEPSQLRKNFYNYNKIIPKSSENILLVFVSELSVTSVYSRFLKRDLLLVTPWNGKNNEGRDSNGVFELLQL